MFWHRVSHFISNVSCIQRLRLFKLSKLIGEAFNYFILSGKSQRFRIQRVLPFSGDKNLTERTEKIASMNV